MADFIVTEFDLGEMFEITLKSQKFEIMVKAIKTMGQLFNFDDEVVTQITQKYPKIIKMPMKYVFDVHSIIPAQIMTEKEREDHKQKLELFRITLWFVSNIAAQNIKIVKSVFEAGYLPVLYDLEKISEQFHYRNIRNEVAFVFCYLCNQSSKSDFLDHLFFQETLTVLIKYLKTPSVVKNATLILEVLQSIGRFLRLERQLQLSEKYGSIRDFFEAEGGVDALQDLCSTENFTIFSLATEILDKFFNADQEAIIEYLFESDFRQNSQNIYDDT